MDHLISNCVCFQWPAVFYSLWFYRPLDPAFHYNRKSRNIPSLHFFFVSRPYETKHTSCSGRGSSTGGKLNFPPATGFCQAARVWWVWMDVDLFSSKVALEWKVILQRTALLKVHSLWVFQSTFESLLVFPKSTL